jgi:hypothetical protein
MYVFVLAITLVATDFVGSGENYIFLSIYLLYFCLNVLSLKISSIVVQNARKYFCYYII